MDKDKLKCSHCGKMRHMKENCWNLVGHPKKFSNPSFMRANSMSSYGSDLGMTYGLQKMVSTDLATSGDGSSKWMVTIPEAELEGIR